MHGNAHTFVQIFTVICMAIRPHLCKCLQLFTWQCTHICDNIYKYLHDNAYTFVQICTGICMAMHTHFEKSSSACSRSTCTEPLCGGPNPRAPRRETLVQHLRRGLFTRRVRTTIMYCVIMIYFHIIYIISIHRKVCQPLQIT